MSKHTPGPWRFGKNSDDVVADTPAGHSEESDHVAYYGGHLVAESICSHNRALVAAAPELLEALQGLLVAYNDPGNTGSTHDDKVEAARAAIAKARGAP